MSLNIVCLPGDGVGPEVLSVAKAVSEAAASKAGLSLSMKDYLFGGVAIDETGDPFPAETASACREADSILLGAVGGPKWDGGAVRPEQGLLGLRKTLELYANLRPITLLPGQAVHSPLRAERVEGLDLLIVRELTGGIYFGEREEGDDIASDRCAYSAAEVERVARVAFTAAAGRRGRVISVDKANVLATSRLWRRTVERVRETEFPEIELTHGLVDAMAMKLIQAPAQYDVLLTENMFGDILSDEASVLAGSIGLAPSASIGVSAAGLYEPIHGSAPDIAGEDKANPVGAILSAAMMFRTSLKAPEAADSIETAVRTVLAGGGGTADIGGSDGTRSFGDKILAALL